MENKDSASTDDSRSFGDTLPVLMWMTDSAGDCHWVNQCWMEFTGVGTEERSAERLDAIHADDVEMVKAALELAHVERDSIELEYRIRSRSGDYRWVLDRAVPRFGDQDEYLGHVGVGVDITHQYEYRRRLQKREQALRQLHELDEREREFYAGAVHDGLLQDVIGAEMLLQALPGVESQQLPEKVARIRQVLRSAIGHGRRLMGELRPMILDEQGLVSAVEYYAMELENRAGIPIAVDANYESPNPHKIWEGNVFRIIQEALNNMELHSQTANADVRLTMCDGDLWAEVEDYGRGFNVDAMRDSFGLQRMQERAEIYGGTLSIKSSGAGTKVTLNIPIPRASRRA